MPHIRQNLFSAVGSILKQASVFEDTPSSSSAISARRLEITEEDRERKRWKELVQGKIYQAYNTVNQGAEFFSSEGRPPLIPNSSLPNCN